MRKYKYKRFFKVPLNKLPWKLPLKREEESTEVTIKGKGQSSEQNKAFTGTFGDRNWQNIDDIDQRILLEILRLIQQRRRRDSFRVAIVASSKAGRARGYNSTTSYEELDSIYESLAPEVRISTQMRKKGLSLPVVDYGYENYDPKSHKISRINFKRMVVDPESPFKKKLGMPLNFQVSVHQYHINVPCRISNKSFPDVCLLIDTSGSMREGGYHIGIPWGERSGYHYALLGLYGIIKYLEGIGVASSILWNVINFSDVTRASGWKTYKEISQLKKHALTPQFGGTEIDIEVLREQLSHEASLVIILSDGEIYNWEKIKDEMEEIVEPHYVSFIQIGKETKVGRDMQKYGVGVVTVKRKEDISQLMVDLTKQVKQVL